MWKKLENLLQRIFCLIIGCFPNKNGICIHCGYIKGKLIPWSQKVIYSVVGVKNEGKQVHTFSLCEKFDLAENLVLSNSCDMCEDGYYKHIVIEKLTLNSMYFIPAPGNTRMKKWYKWHSNKYIECDEPEWAKNIHNWL